nr:hypothetical protein [Sicyoidochytrium minutum DNA virus]
MEKMMRISTISSQTCIR